MSFTCPRCNMTSYHPEDERHGYCGNCHEFTGGFRIEGTVTGRFASTIPSVIQVEEDHEHVWVYVEDEYGSLADGGSYEVYKCSTCGKHKYVQLPD